MDQFFTVSSSSSSSSSSNASSFSSFFPGSSSSTIPLNHMTQMLSIGQQALDAGLLHGGTPQAILSLNKEKLYQYFYSSLQQTLATSQFVSTGAGTSSSSGTGNYGIHTNTYTNIQLSSYWTPLVDGIANALIQNVSNDTVHSKWFSI